MMLDIIKYGDFNSNKLKIKNVDVKKENPFLHQLIINMFDTIEHHNGIVGLSAPQVGHNLNLFVIKTPFLKEVFINPEIRLSGLNIQRKERCLSFPDMEFPVNRRENIEVKFFDENWMLKYGTYKEELSIIIQQAYDHLNGKLIID